MESSRGSAVVGALAVMMVLAACSGSTDPNGPSGTTSDALAGGNGEASRNAKAGTCPFPAPAAGSHCSPKGLECSYGDYPDCPSDLFTCTSGKWVHTSLPACPPPPPPPPASCEATPPTAGTSCSAGLECSYGSNPNCPSDLFTCTGGVWVHEPLTGCLPPPP